MMPTFYDDNWCFCCGRHNPLGLKLEFEFEGQDYVTHFTPTKVFQGFADIVHGGIVSMILDELMARSLWVQERNFVTAELTVRFKRPARVGQELTFRSRVVRDAGRMVEMEAECTDSSGKVVALGTGKLLPAS